MHGSSGVGKPSSSNPPPHQAAQQGQPTAPPTFELKRSSSNANAGNNPEPLAKRSRHSGAFGTSAQPTAPVNSNRQLVQQRVLNHMQRPTQTPPVVDFTLSSGEVGMRGMSAAGSQGGQATFTRTQAPSRQGPQATIQTQVPGLEGQPATPRSGSTKLRRLLAMPMLPSSNPSPTVSTATPLVAWQPPATGTMQRATQTATSTVTPQVVMPRPSSGGAQGTPFVPAPRVHIAPAATAQPTLSAAPSTLALFSNLGLTAEDLNQHDMMDEYLQPMPMGQIPVSSASNPVQNLPLRGQMNPIGTIPFPLPGPCVASHDGDAILRNLLATPMLPLGSAQTTAQTSASGAVGPSVPSSASDSDHQLIRTLAQPYVDAELTRMQAMRPTSVASTATPQVAALLPPAAWANPLPQPLSMPSANNAAPTPDPAL